MNNNIIKELYERYIINQISNKKKLMKYFNINKNINLYCGFDPTNDSLHIGHLFCLITLKRFYNYGNNIYILIGNSTALIGGDPSFKKKNILNNIEKIEIFNKKIKEQIIKISDINNFKVNIINNDKWFKKINLIKFIYKIGNYFSINKLFNNNFLKNRININYSELSYILLQSYDYLYLNKKYNVKLQIGGSDQWNNINYGIKLINKILNRESYGITIPLIINKYGEKFGKSNSNNIWIDENKTTPYNLYQYIINISNNDTLNLIRLLTFEDLNYIFDLKNLDSLETNILLKRILFKNLNKIIYNNYNSIIFINAINNLFSNNIHKISENCIKELIKFGINSIYMKFENVNIFNILINLNLFNSYNKINKYINNNKIKLNTKLVDKNYILSKQDLIYNKYTFIFISKKKCYLIIWE